MKKALSGPSQRKSFFDNYKALIVALVLSLPMICSAQTKNFQDHHTADNYDWLKAKLYIGMPNYTSGPSTPASSDPGGLYYNTTGHIIYVWNGSAWDSVHVGAITANTNTAWKQLGNASTISGTNYIGTSDAVDLDFRTGATLRARFINSTGKFTTYYDAILHGITAGLGASSIASNTAFGYQALNAVTSGTWNTGFGYQALNALTSGTGNTALGYGALISNTSGSSNTSVGINALFTNTTGLGNVGVGGGALGVNTTGGSNTSVGNSSLNNNTTGFGNTAVGIGALSSNISGSWNTGIGDSTGYVLTTGSNNTFLGARIQSPSSSTSNNIFIADGAGNIKARHDGTNWTLTGGLKVTALPITGTYYKTVRMDAAGNFYGSDTSASFDSTSLSNRINQKFSKSGDSTSYTWYPNQTIATTVPASGIKEFDSSGRLYVRTSLNKTYSISTSNITANTSVIDSLPNKSGTFAFLSDIPTNPVGGTGTLNYIPKWTPNGTTLGNSLIYDNGTNVGIGAASLINAPGGWGGPAFNIAGTGPSVLLRPTANSNTALFVSDGSSTQLRAEGMPFIFYSSNGYVDFWGGGARAMRINASQNVSVGNTNDTYKLDVTGTFNASGNATIGGNLNASNLVSASNLIQIAPNTLAGNKYNFTSTSFSVPVDQTIAGTLTGASANFSGGITVGVDVTASGNIRAGSGNAFYWNGRSQIWSGSDGNIKLTNSTTSDFGLLQLGGTTSSFPSIARNGTGIDIKLADNSGYAPLAASTIGLSGLTDYVTGVGGAVDIYAASGLSARFTAGNIRTTSITGGTTTTSSLTYKTTTGVGITGADHIFLVGNNGATEAMRILNSGFVGIGTAESNGPLNVQYQFAKTDVTERSVYNLKSSEAYASNPFTLSVTAKGDPSVAANRYYSYQTGVSGVSYSGNIVMQANGGNVGIGTTSPDSLLTVNTSAHIKNFLQVDQKSYVGAVSSTMKSSYSGQMIHTATDINTVIQGTGFTSVNDAVSAYTPTCISALSLKVYTGGNTSAASSAIVDIESTTKGLLIPRMTTTQMNAISSPATGLEVYDNVANNFKWYNGTAWRTVADSANAAVGSTLPVQFAAGDTLTTFGDSYTVQWAGRLAKYLGVTVNNHGVAGTTLEKQPPFNYMASPSMTDNLSAIPFWSPKQKMLIFAYGLNDLGNNGGGYNPTNFKAAYDTVLNYAVSSRGWAGHTRGMMIISPYYIDSSGYAGYASLTGNAAPTTAWHKQFVAACHDASSKWGTQYIDMYDDIYTNNPFLHDSATMIHPNTQGYTFIAQDIYRSLKPIQSNVTTGTLPIYFDTTSGTILKTGTTWTAIGGTNYGQGGLSGVYLMYGQSGRIIATGSSAFAVYGFGAYNVLTSYTTMKGGFLIDNTGLVYKDDNGTVTTTAKTANAAYLYCVYRDNGTFYLQESTDGGVTWTTFSTLTYHSKDEQYVVCDIAGASLSGHLDNPKYSFTGGNNHYGAILYSDGSNSTQDYNNLSYNATTKHVGIGTADADCALTVATSFHVGGYAKIDGVSTFGAPVTLKGYTVATLPAGTVGMTAYVTDAAASPVFLATATGGGSLNVPVFYNGSNWVYH